MTCRYCNDTKKLVLFTSVVKCTECALPNVAPSTFEYLRTVVLSAPGWVVNTASSWSTKQGIEEYYVKDNRYYIGLHGVGSEHQTRVMEKVGKLPAWSYCEKPVMQFPVHGASIEELRALIAGS